MNAMSLAISKPCCPMYNLGTSNNFGRFNNSGTRNKIDLTPSRLSNLHLQGTTSSVAIATHVLKMKSRPYLLSALKDGKGGPTPQVPEVSSVVLPSVLLCVAIIGIALAKPCIALAKPWEVVVQSISTMGGIPLAKPWEGVVQYISTIGGILKSYTGYHVFPLVYATSAVGVFLNDILAGNSLIHSKFFSIGEIVQLGSVKGRVTKIGRTAYSLLGAENVPILVPNSFIPSEGLINISRVSCCKMVSKIFVQDDEIQKIYKISVEIQNMMKSNSNVYLKNMLPDCYISDVKERYCAELTLGCHLKMMCEDELLLAKQDVLLQSVQIIKKHGAKLLTK